MLLNHKEFQEKNIRYGFFTRDIGGSKNIHSEQNKIAAKAFGSTDIAILDQKHSNIVIETNHYGDFIEADAQVTSKSNIAIAVLTADCVPILLADNNAKIIAAVHSGWRGTKANIIWQTITKMKSLGAREINAIIGPCIRKNSYEVGEEIYNQFCEIDQNYKSFFSNSLKENHYNFDLPGIVKDQLASSGINRILDLELDTYANKEKFFSYRRHTHNPSEEKGSLLSVIMLT